jgi:hypothetical protein
MKKIKNIILEEYNKIINETLSPKQFALKLSDKVGVLDAGFGEKAYNYKNKNGVEVTITDDYGDFEIRGNQVQADIHIDYIGVDKNRGEGFASQELNKIINLADSLNLSLSVVVDPEKATTNITGEKSNTIGLDGSKIQSWLSKRGFIFDGKFGYRPSNEEDKSKYILKTIRVNPKDVDPNKIDEYSCPEDFFDSVKYNNLGDGYYSDGDENIYLIKNSDLYFVENLKLYYDYKNFKYELVKR